LARHITAYSNYPYLSEITSARMLMLPPDVSFSAAFEVKQSQTNCLFENDIIHFLLLTAVVLLDVTEGSPDLLDRWMLGDVDWSLCYNMSSHKVP
jgi:hypothetical protein